MAASEPRSIALVLGGPLAPGDVPEVCARARALLEGSDAEVVVCDLSPLADGDVVAVEAVARLQLTARRLGRRLCLRGASPELRALLAFVGLGDVLAWEGATPRAGEAGRTAGTGSPCRGRT